MTAFPPAGQWSPGLTRSFSHDEWGPTAVSISSGRERAHLVEWDLADLFDLRAHYASLPPALRALTRSPLDIAFLVVGAHWGGHLRECRAVRAAGAIPIAVVGQGSTVAGRIKFFDAGADDVFDTDAITASELVCRVHSIVHRFRGGTHPSVVRSSTGLIARYAEREVLFRGSRVSLTRAETELLALLLDREGQVVPIATMAQHLSEIAFDGQRNHIQKLVSRLREKLRSAGASAAVDTVRGVGYRIA